MKIVQPSQCKHKSFQLIPQKGFQCQWCDEFFTFDETQKVMFQSKNNTKKYDEKT